jgi:hypothetical protein
VKRYIIRPGDWTSDRAAWLNCLLHGPHTGFNPKPPESWVHMQENQEGRNASAAYSIWHKYYKPERKYVIWDQAPDEDWIRAGYLVE